MTVFSNSWTKRRIFVSVHQHVRTKKSWSNSGIYFRSLTIIIIFIFIVFIIFIILSSFFIYVLSSNVTGIQSCEIAREKFLADYKSINFTDWFIDGKRENLIQVEDPIELLQSNDTSPDWIPRFLFVIFFRHLIKNAFLMGTPCHLLHDELSM